MINGYFQLEPAAGGARIRIMPPIAGGEKTRINEVADYLSSRGYVYDLPALNQAIESGERTTVPVSGTSNGLERESYRLIVSDDNMLATVRFYAPSVGGEYMTYEEFLKDLRFRYISYGIKEEELKTKEEIELALKENRIIAYIQPIYDVKKEKFTCGECLCRMRRKGGEIMMPFRFIGIAEKYGLICDIETEMFKNMCKILQQKEELGLESLEANLSIKKGESKHLYEEYVEIMEKYGIDGKYISLEITETDVMEEKNALLGNMNNLKSIGIKFALDDFGTGESNLGYVIDMPIDTMKFDRNIFQKATREIKARLVVENTIEMAHKLGLNVIVEGVETEEDFEICKDMNVDFVQGYYFSRPISFNFLRCSSQSASISNSPVINCAFVVFR